MANKKKSRFKKNRGHARLKVGAIVPPPGITIEYYELHDLRNFSGTSLSENKEKYVLSVWTTLRDKLIDHWLTVERILRTACVILLTESDAVRPRLWEIFKKQNGEYLIDITYDLLKSKGYKVPKDFKQPLKRLAATRNILAHLASRPAANKMTDKGLVFLKPTGFNEAEYIEVRFEEIQTTIDSINPIMEWLVQAIPESDGAHVTMDDDVFSRLNKAKKPRK